jgi:hypothetical protein
VEEIRMKKPNNDKQCVAWICDGCGRANMAFVPIDWGISAVMECGVDEECEHKTNTTAVVCKNFEEFKTFKAKNGGPGIAVTESQGRNPYPSTFRATLRPSRS